MAMENLLLTVVELWESHIPGEGFKSTLISEDFHTFQRQTSEFWSYLPPVCTHIEIQVNGSLSMCAK